MDRYLLLPEGPGLPLTPAEDYLVKCARLGAIWDPKSARDAETGVITPDTSREFCDIPPIGKPDTVIRAEVIRSLVTGIRWEKSKRPWALHARGVLIANARIEGDIDLEGCTVLSQLWLVNCHIYGRIKLQDATTKSIGLDGSRLLDGRTLSDNPDKKIPDENYYSLCARRTEINGNLYLRLWPNGEKEADSTNDEGAFYTQFAIKLAGTHISGDLDCRGGQFNHPVGEYALDCSETTIGNDVLLSNGFMATKRVDFPHAKIGGSFHCEAGCFSKGEKKTATTQTKDVEKENDHQEEQNKEEKNAALNIYLAQIGAGLHLTKVKAFDGDIVLTQADAHTFYCDTSVKPSKRLPSFKAHWWQSKATIRKSEEGCCIYLDGFTYQRFMWTGGCRTYFGNPFRNIYEYMYRCIDFIWRKLSREDTAPPKDWVTENKILPTIITEWLMMQPDRYLKKEFRPQPWVQAAKVFRDMGHAFYARDIAYNRERKRLKRPDLRWSQRFWQYFLWLTIGFGYKPFRALWFLGGLFLFSWLSFATAANFGYMEPRQDTAVVYFAEAANKVADEPKSPQIQKQIWIPSHYTKFNAFTYALDVILPIVELGQDQTWAPTVHRSGCYQRYLPETRLKHFLRFIFGKASLWNSNVDKNNDPQVLVCVGTNGKINISTWESLFVRAFNRGGHRALYWFDVIYGWIITSLIIMNVSRILGRDE